MARIELGFSQKYEFDFIVNVNYKSHEMLVVSFVGRKPGVFRRRGIGDSATWSATMSIIWIGFYLHGTV